MPDRIATPEEFLVWYAERNQQPLGFLREKTRPVPCVCEYEHCRGWVLLNPIPGHPKPRPQAKDIPDQAVFDAVDGLSAGGQRWVLLHELVPALGFPRKVVLAKARKLILRGTLEGCWCGCRGDFYLPGGKWG